MFAKSLYPLRRYKGRTVKSDTQGWILLPAFLLPRNTCHTLLPIRGLAVSTFGISNFLPSSRPLHPLRTFLFFMRLYEISPNSGAQFSASICSGIRGTYVSLHTRAQQLRKVHRQPCVCMDIFVHVGAKVRGIDKQRATATDRVNIRVQVYQTLSGTLIYDVIRTRCELTIISSANCIEHEAHASSFIVDFFALQRNVIECGCQIVSKVGIYQSVTILDQWIFANRINLLLR